MRDQSRADTTAGMLTIDGEAAEQQRWDRVGSLLGKRRRRGTVDRGHCETRVCDDLPAWGCDHPRGSGVAAAVLARVAAQPLVKRRLARVEVAAVVPSRIERLRATKISQPSGSRAGDPTPPPAAR